MIKTKTAPEFVKSLVWKNGKPFCPDCECEIQPCHKCGRRTATEDSIAYTCKSCSELGTSPCQLCKECFAQTDEDAGTKDE